MSDFKNLGSILCKSIIFDGDKAVIETAAGDKYTLLGAKITGFEQILKYEDGTPVDCKPVSRFIDEDEV